MADLRISDLVTASQLKNDDYYEISQSESGTRVSYKATLLAIAVQIATMVDFTSDLNTTSKKITGAINELKQLISLIPQFSIEVVQELPTEDISDTTIYLVPAEDPEVGNYYEEYIHVNDSWELVGTTAVDLSAYYTKLEVDAKFSALATVATSGSYNDLTNKPDLSALMDVNETTFTNPYTKKLVPSGQFTEKLKKLIGASVVWNQILQYGDFTDATKLTANNATATVSSGVATFTPNTGRYQTSFGITATGAKNAIVDHVYLYHGYIKITDNLNKNTLISPILAQYVDCGKLTPNVDTFVMGTVKAVSTNLIRFFVYPWGTGNNDFDGTQKLYSHDFWVTDLTDTFGSTIADYVNTLETQTAGSGIAWLKSYGFFTEPYYAYSANTIQSVSVSGKKNVGKNKLEKPFVYSDNVTTDLSNYFLIRKGQYTFSFGSITATSWRFVIRLKDKNGNVLSDNAHLPIPSGFSYSSSRSGYMSNSNVTSKSIVLDIVEDCYIRILFAVGDTTTSTTATSCQLEIGNIATAYSPYTSETTTLDHTTLRGLFKLDANNNLYADGDEYLPSGGENVKYAEVDLGDYGWTYDSTYQRFYTNVSIMKDVGTPRTTQLVCAKYQPVFNGESMGNVPDKAIYTAVTNLYIHDSAYTDATAFRTAVTGVKCIIPLETPTTETLTPYTSLQNIESGGTEEFIDYGVEQGTRDVAIPVGNETAYGDNELMGKVVNYIND